MLSEEQLDQLRNGLDLSDGPTRPAIVNRLRNSEKYSFIEMTITEGRNRQVRRMIEAIGTKVMKLTRVAIGPIRIDNLEVGRHRELTPDELAAIEKSAAGE
jgi:pseudouridine synthase